MNVRSLFSNKQGFSLSLIALVLAATSVPAAAQGVSAAPQRLENLDARGLSAIASATKLPNGIKRSPQLDTVVSQLRKGDQKAALANWTSYISEINKQGVPVDMDALVQWVLRESYLQTGADLNDTADKIRYYNEAKKRLRDEIAQGRTDLSEARPWPRDRRVAVFRTKYARGADPVEREEKSDDY